MRKWEFATKIRGQKVCSKNINVPEEVPNFLKEKCES